MPRFEIEPAKAYQRCAIVGIAKPLILRPNTEDMAQGL